MAGTGQESNKSDEGKRACLSCDTFVQVGIAGAEDDSHRPLKFLDSETTLVRERIVGSKSSFSLKNAGRVPGISVKLFIQQRYKLLPDISVAEKTSRPATSTFDGKIR